MSSGEFWRENKAVLYTVGTELSKRMQKAYSLFSTSRIASCKRFPQTWPTAESIMVGARQYVPFEEPLVIGNQCEISLKLHGRHELRGENRTWLLYIYPGYYWGRPPSEILSPTKADYRLYDYNCPTDLGLTSLNPLWTGPPQRPLWSLPGDMVGVTQRGAPPRPRTAAHTAAHRADPVRSPQHFFTGPMPQVLQTATKSG